MDINSLSSKLDKVVDHYCDTFNIEKNNEWFLLKVQEELGELVQVYLEVSGKSRTRHLSEESSNTQFEAEIADVVAVLLAMAKYNNIDILKAIEEKWLKWL